jgi:hypothetical protein
MSYDVHLRLHADLVGVARVIRVLRRYAVAGADVAIAGPSGADARMHGTLAAHGKAVRLVAALVRTPDVAYAAILDESRVVLEFSRAPR